MNSTIGLADDELDRLRLAYKQAFDEYTEATFAIHDRLRRRALPTAEAFARKRAAHSALLLVSAAIWRASREEPRDRAWITKPGRPL